MISDYVVQPTHQQEEECIQVFDFNNVYRNVEFTCALTSDLYRKGQPYKVLHYPGKSRLDMTIDVTPGHTTNQHIACLLLELVHCATNCKGVIDIYVNDVPFLVGHASIVWDAFAEQRLRIPPTMCKPGVNVLTIVLNPNSPGVYWVSDARVAIEYK